MLVRFYERSTLFVEKQTLKSRKTEKGAGGMEPTNMREYFLENERQTLSVYACLSSNIRGREKPCVPCQMRTEFQRDRDRILHCQSFRRLMNKTQVFLAPTGDHYRTRMTHTLEVTQIARIIARALRLNEDLTEAVAMGHDIGHTPFGHAGEYAMQKCFDPEFTHYKQSLRVVEKLENNGEGLNLTWEVRDGIVNHTGKHVALGGDLDGCKILPDGFTGVESYSLLADRLIQRGLSLDTVKDIFWNNAMGVITECCT